MSGFELLERLQAEPALRDIPVVVFTGKELAGEEEARLRTVAKSIVLKDVQSPERLLDETALFLHRVIGDLPEEKRRMIERLHGSTEVLRGRKVLVVDDDARNIFALTTVLENQEMEVLSATNGRQAIEIINATPDLSVVLMDIMMPEMDGYETMREIRKDAEVPHAPHPVAHRQGDEGRSREVPGGGGLGLHRQTGEHGSAAVAAPGLAVPLDGAPHRHIAGRRRGPKPRRAGGDPGEPQLSAAAGRGRRSGAAPAAGERRRGHRPRHQDAPGGRLRAGADDQEHAAVSRDAHRVSDRPPHRRSARDRRLRRGRGRLPDQAGELAGPQAQDRGVRRAVPQDPRAGRAEREARGAGQGTHPGARTLGGGAAGGRPAEGRVSGDPRPRAAQPARAPAQRPRSAAAPEGRRAGHRAHAGDDEPAAPPHGSFDRRSARHLPGQPGIAGAEEGAGRPG